MNPNHTKMGQKYHFDSLVTIDFSCLIWIYMMNLYFGCAELYFYLSVFGQITHQSIDLVKLSKNVRSEWYFWLILVWFGFIYIKNTFYRSRAIAQIYAKIQFCLNFSNCGWKKLNYGIYCLRKCFLINNRFFPIITDYKISFFSQNTTDFKKSALLHCKVTNLEYIAWNPILKKWTVLSE